MDGKTKLLGEEDLLIIDPIPVINLHPALPGQFDGANAVERAYEAFIKGDITKFGAMVHRVVKDVDRGEPVVVKGIASIEGESLEEYEARLHKLEHEIIVQGTKKVLDEIKPLLVSTPFQ